MSVYHNATIYPRALPLDGTEVFGPVYQPTGSPEVDRTVVASALIGPQTIYAGLVADGVTDDALAWAALVAKLGALQAAGVPAVRVVLPGGVSVCSTPITITLSNLALRIAPVTQLTISFPGTGSGLTVHLTNGSNFECENLAISRPAAASLSGSGFWLDSDVIAGPPQPMKRIRHLDVSGSWTSGVVIKASQVDIYRLDVNLFTTAAYAFSTGTCTGLFWGGIDASHYCSGLYVTQATIQGAYAAVQFSPFAQGAWFTGGSLLACAYGAVFDGTGGAIQEVHFAGTNMTCTTRSFLIEGGAQFIEAVGGLHQPFVGGAGSAAVASVDGRWVVAQIAGGSNANSFRALTITANGVANSSAFLLATAPQNEFADCITTGCTNYAALIDNTSYECSFRGFTGGAQDGAKAFFDPGSVFNGTQCRDINYNSIDYLTSGVLVANAVGGSLLPAQQGTTNIGTPTNPFNIISAVEMTTGMPQVIFQSVSNGAAGLLWVGSNGTTPLAGIVPSLGAGTDNLNYTGQLNYNAGSHVIGGNVTVTGSAHFGSELISQHLWLLGSDFGTSYASDAAAGAAGFTSGQAYIGTGGFVMRKA